MAPLGDEPAARSAASGLGLARRRLVVGLVAGGVSCLAGCPTSDTEADSPGIEAATDTAIGTPFPIHLTGAAGTVDEIRLTVVDRRDVPFSGRLEPTAGHDGGELPLGGLRDGDAAGFATRTDASSQPPVTTGLGGDGPLRMVAHHLEPDGSATGPQFLPGDPQLPADAVDGGYDVTIEAHHDGDVVAASTVTRTLATPGVTERAVPVEDLVGRVARPPADDPIPGVVVLHGSGATDLYGWARMLATHGYAVLTLKYFAEPGLPATLDDIPLEYFERAVEWFTGREDIHDDRLGVVGLSRGVEAALLTAAGFDGAATVVGYGGSGIVHPGLTEVYALDRTSPPDEALGAAGWEAAWTRDGEPIVDGEQIRAAYGRIGRLELDELEPVGIPVEAIEGPVLLLSGQEDALWRASLFSEYAIRRRAAIKPQSACAHVSYDGAGHLFFWPYRAYDGVLTARPLGGSPAANAQAAADAWVRLLEYLETGLAPSATTS